MVEITFKGDRFNITLEGENVLELTENYLKMEEEINRKLKSSKGSQNQKTISNEIKRKKSMADNILSLDKLEFFNQPRTINEIKDKLNELGFFYPITSFPAYLLKLCRERKLRRFKEIIDKKKIWVYVRV